jgi:hypothetical protein
MGEGIKLQLDDGSEILAIVEGDAADEELLRSLGRVRLAAGDQDVEGHALGSALDVIVYGPDDVEGHAMTLRLPHPEAARDLQRKLLAAGVVGVIIVGAATTSMWVPDLGVGVASQATAAAAPAAARALTTSALRAEKEDSIVATVQLPKAPPSSGLRAEKADSIVATAPVVKAPPSSGLRAEKADSIVATAPVVKAPPSSGLRAEREDSIVATPDEPATQADHQGMRRD